MAIVYSREVARLEIITTNLKKTHDLIYELVVIVKAQTQSKNYDDAYKVRLSFNEKKQIKKVELLDPEENHATNASK